MEAHQKDWEAVVAAIEVQLGFQYDPSQRDAVRPSLTQIFTTELPQFSSSIVAQALEKTLLQTTATVEWQQFICFFLSQLPGWWMKLVNNPGFNASTMLLLTDGTVMCQEEGGLRWKKLTPDATGSYVNGTWSDLAPMHNTRRYYASAVLRDGRVWVCGGEYSDAGGWTNKTEIYDPITDAWTVINPPPGWNNIGDAPCAVLPDGHVLVGSFNSTKTAIYDPDSNTWAAGPLKGATSSEESWVLLPDHTVITVRCDNSQRADKYVAATNSWVDGGILPAGIIELSSSEIGAGVLLNDGRAIFIGANNRTALYSRPLVAADAGVWSSGPVFPNDTLGRNVGCKDSPSCLMTNGKVLIAAGPVDGTNWLTPTYFHEFDGTALNRVVDPPNATNVPYIGRMLLLPTGQILFAAQTNEIYAYNYFACPPASTQPVITSQPNSVRPWHTYTLHGRNFNGLSQAVGYGDDAAAATNYPLVRIRHLATGTVTYCRTFDHSTMGVATGSATVSTNFLVPWETPTGPSELCVVANGVASPSVPLVVAPFMLRLPIFEEGTVNRLIGSLADGPLWVLGPNGPIPVDPWGPKVGKAGAEAWQHVLIGVKSLQKIGHDISASRQQSASAAPLAPDEDDEQEELDKAKAKEK